MKIKTLTMLFTVLVLAGCVTAQKSCNQPKVQAEQHVSEQNEF